jgi:hypothetical protein
LHSLVPSLYTEYFRSLMSTYTPIATQTLGSAAASVTFSSIPQGYTDLVIVVNAGASAATANGGIRFNGDTGNNYSQTTMRGNGSAAASANIAKINLDYYGFTTSLTNLEIIQIQNYSNSTTYKTVLARGDSADYGVRAQVGLWRNTSAITRIDFKSDAYNFITGSTFSLYGIQVGTAAQKAQGGNIVTSDGTYVYHTFTSSGAFIPSEALTVDYLVVAGGGGGGGAGAGSRGAGGGGAGGMRSTVTATGGGGSLETALSLTAKSYPVIVGSGGTGGTVNVGTKGGDSVFATVTSAGGGYGGAWNTTDGILPSSGGSGGGMPDAQGMGSTTGGAGTTNQGYAGGNNLGSPDGQAGSGGGGAGGSGGNIGSTQTANGGAGGTGVAVSISGSSITYAAGGAGGNQTGNQTPSNATANTGNGGGGKGGGAGLTNGVGANGGSGIVIIRYAI